MRKLSIGIRLTIWYLAIFALGQFAFGAGMWLVLHHHLIGIVDDALQDQTEDLRAFLVSQKPDSDLAKFREEVRETYSQEHAGEYLALFTSTHELVYVSPSLQDVRSMTPAEAEHTELPATDRFQDRLVGGKHLRFLRSTIETHGLTFIVQLGTPTREVWEVLEAVRDYLLSLAPLVLLLSGAGGYWMSRRALAPVGALTRTARTISGHTLGRRLEKLHTGDELQHLSDTLNEMLDRIEQSFRRIAEFTADASHELRTPISLMRTEAELALRKPRNADSYREALEHILKETERTSVLVEDLLSLARADSASQSVALLPVELGSLLRQTASQWTPMAVAHGHNLNLEAFPSHEIWVMADESALRRVFMILLDNAVKYTPEPGRIDVTLLPLSERAVVTVSDTGVGIPADELVSVFERFYRVDKARSRQLGGSGLGLAIARWIVESHAGSITVESIENQGSRFSVSLPTTPRDSSTVGK